MAKLLLAAVTGVVLLAAPRAEATLITFDFELTQSNVQPFIGYTLDPGDLISGSFTYDDAAVDLFAGSNIGQFGLNSAPTSLSFSLIDTDDPTNPVLDTYTADLFQLLLRDNDPSVGDSFEIFYTARSTSSPNFGSFFSRFNTLTNLDTVLDPNTLTSLASLDFSSFDRFDGRSTTLPLRRNGFYSQGSLTPPVAVPEVSTLAMFGIGLAWLGLVGWRARRRAA